MLCATLLALPACKTKLPPYQRQKQVTITSSVPDSEVYLDGVLLGKTPLILKAARLEKLGVPWPVSVTHGNQLWNSWELDTFGIVTQEKEDADNYKKFYFKPPQDTAGKLLTIETPLGRMAECKEMGTHPDIATEDVTYEVDFDTAQSTDGLSLTLTADETAPKAGGKSHITLTCENKSGTALSCYRPEVEIYCDRPDRPTAHEPVVKLPLPDSWLSFPPGAKQTATLEFTFPPDSGDYCLFAIVTLHKEAAGDKIFDGIYSNGKQLHLEK